MNMALEGRSLGNIINTLENSKLKTDSNGKDRELTSPKLHPKSRGPQTADRHVARLPTRVAIDTAASLQVNEAIYHATLATL